MSNSPQKITHLNTSEFAKIQNNITDNIITTKVNADKLKIYSIEGHKFKIDDQILDADPNFIYSFGKLFGLTNRLQNKMMKGDKKIYRQVIGHLNQFFVDSVVKNSKLILIGEPQTKKLVGITWQDGFTRITNQRLYQIASNITSEFIQFRPQLVSITNSRFMINLVSLSPIKIHNEYYATGISLINDISGTYAVQYIGNTKNKWCLLPGVDAISESTGGSQFEEKVQSLAKSMINNEYALLSSGNKSLFYDLRNNYTNLATVEDLYKIFKRQVNKATEAEESTIMHVADTYLPEMKKVFKVSAESNQDFTKMKKQQKRQIQVSTSTLQLLTRCLSAVHDKNVKLYDSIKFIKDVSSLFSLKSNVKHNKFKNG